MCVLGLNPAFLQQIRNAGYNRVTARDAIRMRVLGVSIADVRDLHRLFPAISLNQATDLAMVGVSATYVKDLRGIGLRGLSPDNLTELKLAEISQAYVKSLNALALEPLSPDQVIQLRMLDVNVGTE